MNFHHLKRLAILLSVFSFAPNLGYAASHAPLRLVALRQGDLPAADAQ